MADELTHSEKIRQAIIKKYGSWEAYKAQRYHTPEAKEKLLKAQRAGGKASTNRPFRDREFARMAAKKARNGKQNAARA